ncbi:MAG: Peptidoglycan-binding lysin domain protein, partial [Deltaproteobacteria bacterium]|nr:Peptidoglycan-binding lysin domain protein [Deltaproteobacteria bacterium]
NGDFPKLDSMEGVAKPKVVTSSSLDNKWSTEQAAPLVSSSELKEQKVAFHTGTSSELEATLPIKNDVAEKVELAPTKTVVVERDDYLRKIIQRAYGKCNESLMAKVLKENPEIRTADQIFVGQVIRLPEIDPK